MPASDTRSDFAPAPGRYESGAAAFHVFAYARRRGWAPLLTLCGGYFAYLLLAMAVMLAAMWPVMQVAMTAPTDAEPEAVFRSGALGWAALGWLVYCVALLVGPPAFEAALLRWLFGGPVRVRFLGAELKLLALLIFFGVVLPLVLFLPFLVLFGLASAAGSILTGILAALVLAATLFVWVGVAARFAPAAALTVHDGGFGLFRAWRLTARDYWPIFGGYVLVWLVYLGVSFGVQIALQPVMIVSVMPVLGDLAPGGDMTPEDVRRMMQGLGPFYALSLLSSAVSLVLFTTMMAGANAYTVKRAAAAP